MSALLPVQASASSNLERMPLNATCVLVLVYCGPMAKYGFLTLVGKYFEFDSLNRTDGGPKLRPPFPLGVMHTIRPHWRGWGVRQKGVKFGNGNKRE